MLMPDGLDDLYQEIILDHYRHPRNKGLLADADLQAEGYNPFCGDQVRLTMDLDESGHVHKVGFDGQGCSISQASASILTKLVKGRSVDEVQGLVATVRRIMQGADMTDEQKDELGELEALEGVKKFPIRVKCALLPWTTLQDAVSEYRKTHAQ